MVKFVIRKKEYDWNGKLVKIVADIEYNHWRKQYDRITRTWSEFCEKFRRFDVKTKRFKYKTYTPLKAAQEEKEYEIKHEKTREERRQNCKCKEKCKAEFSNCTV